MKFKYEVLKLRGGSRSNSAALQQISFDSTKESIGESMDGFMRHQLGQLLFQYVWLHGNVGLVTRPSQSIINNAAEISPLKFATERKIAQ